MNHYHVCVYAICKNEAKFVPGWIESMREADSIVVLDTGSTDETVRLLEEGGAKVTREIISPWRFDTARNRSLELVPEEADICVCTDLDELLRPGWRALLEAAWKPEPARQPTATSGISTRTAVKGSSSGMKRCMPGVSTAGFIRSMKCWNTSEKDRVPKRFGSRGCSWTIMPIPPSRGHSTCPCWNSRSVRTQGTTAAFTTSAGNIFSSAAGTTPSAR